MSAWCFLWLLVGFAIGFGAAILFLFLLGSSPEDLGMDRSKLHLFFRVLPSSWSIIALFAAACVSYVLELDKTAAILVLIAMVLLVATLAGRAYGLLASVVAVGLLTYLFLPPIGSVRVSDPRDRLALALFLVTAAVGSQLVGGGKRLRGS